MSSPPTRGCSGGFPADELIFCVFPADAGVLRSARRTSSAATGLPRRRGGAPFVLGVGLAHIGSSPPTRGCSELFADLVLRLHVFPADAGVLRERRSTGSSVRSPPYRRGGVPLMTISSSRTWKSSPPTWGCAGCPQVGGRLPHVLPTDVGVCRVPRTRHREPPRPPHRRGGASLRTAENLKKLMSSPPTRGCFADQPREGPRGDVFPADAGVLRTGRGTSPPWQGLPRRRGGASSGPGRHCRPGRSSPPTRGCSVLAGHGHAVLVLPTDVGCAVAHRRRDPGADVLPANVGVCRSI
jgi:hypothetical protein